MPMFSIFGRSTRIRRRPAAAGKKLRLSASVIKIAIGCALADVSLQAPIHVVGSGGMRKVQHLRAEFGQRARGDRAADHVGIVQDLQSGQRQLAAFGQDGRIAVADLCHLDHRLRGRAAADRMRAPFIGGAHDRDGAPFVADHAFDRLTVPLQNSDLHRARRGARSAAP